MSKKECEESDISCGNRKEKRRCSEREKPELNYILMMQVLVCMLILAFTLIVQRTDKPLFQSVKRQFTEIMDNGIMLDDKLIRFVSGDIQNERVASRVVFSKKKYYGSGGYKPAKHPDVPKGYSLKSFIPDFPLNIPVDFCAITSEYGWRKHPISKKSDFHTGVDLAAAEGTLIKPAAEGMVIKTDRSKSYGNYVLVLHEDGVTTKYCHMQYVFVHTGEIVSADATLGTVGSTGMATGPHLHFELMYNDIGCNPKKALGLQ